MRPCDRPGRLDLRVHGVQRDDGAFQFEQRQQHRYGGDFVRLLIHRQLPQRSGELVDPLMRGGEELARVEPGEHPTERVMRRHPVSQLDGLSKPVPLGLGKPLDIDPAVRSTDGRGQRHEHHLQQIVILPPINSQVCHLCKMPLSIYRRSHHATLLHAETNTDPHNQLTSTHTRRNPETKHKLNIRLPWRTDRYWRRTMKVAALYGD